MNMLKTRSILSVVVVILIFILPYATENSQPNLLSSVTMALVILLTIFNIFIVIDKFKKTKNINIWEIIFFMCYVFVFIVLWQQFYTI